MNWKWLLALSLALNVVLALVIRWERRAASPLPAAHPAAAPANAIYRESGMVWPQKLATEDARLTRRGAAPAHSIEAADYPTFIRRLRAAGLSDETILTLVVAEFQQREQDEYIELQLQFDRGELSQEELQERTEQGFIELNESLEALLGRETYRSYRMSQDFEIVRLAESGKFSEEALAAYFDLRSKYTKLRNDLAKRWEAGGFAVANYQTEALNLETEYRTDLEKHLGTQAAREILAATDDTVQSLRRQLRGPALTDEETLNVAQILRDYTEGVQSLSILEQRGYQTPQESQLQEASLLEEKTERLRAVLGPDRYAEYEKQSDSTFQQMKLWASHNALSESQVNYLYSVVKNWKEQQQALQSQAAAMPEEVGNDAFLQELQLAEDQRLADWEQVSAATRDTLQAYLGAERYEQLKQSAGPLP